MTRKRNISWDSPERGQRRPLRGGTRASVPVTAAAAAGAAGSSGAAARAPSSGCRRRAAFGTAPWEPHCVWRRRSRPARGWKLRGGPTRTRAGQGRRGPETPRERGAPPAPAPRRRRHIWRAREAQFGASAPAGSGLPAGKAYPRAQERGTEPAGPRRARAPAPLPARRGPRTPSPARARPCGPRQTARPRGTQADLMGRVWALREARLSSGCPLARRLRRGQAFRGRTRGGFPTPAVRLPGDYPAAASRKQVHAGEPTQCAPGAEVRTRDEEVKKVGSPRSS